MHTLMSKRRCNANDALIFKNFNRYFKNNAIGSNSNVALFIDEILQESAEVESRVFYNTIPEDGHHLKKLILKNGRGIKDRAQDESATYL